MAFWSTIFYLFFVVFQVNYKVAESKRVSKTTDFNEEYLNFDHFLSHDEVSDTRRLSSDSLPKSEDHKISSLPGLSRDDSVTQYAGHLPVDPSHGGYFFYWLFDSKKDADKKPLVIWLNGGPGCSSMDGLWLELGPFRIIDGGRAVKWNKYSWHEAGNLLFIDQPVGTGLSFTNSKEGLAKNDKMVNEHFYTFLQNFFTVHSRFVNPAKNGGRARTRQIVFAGESHAGHYIPSLVQYILDQNDANSDKLEMMVQGIALGNPWIDPPNQYNPAEFAHGLGLISSGQVNRLKEQERQCQNLLREGKLNNKVCMNLLDDIIDSSSIGSGAKVIMYDTRQYSVSSRSFPPGHEDVEAYLNRIDVKQAIHAMRTPQKYVECADPPYYALSHQDGKGVTEEVVSLLDRGVPILIYSGQYDMICNHVNMEKVLDNLMWSSRNEWLNAQPGVWMKNNRPAGYIRKYKNLQSLLVLNAGHMVPMDQPEIALEMLKSFIAGEDFSSGPTKVGVTVSPAALCSLTTDVTTATSTSASAGLKHLNNRHYNNQHNKEHRSLLANDRSAGSNLQFYPVLIHATPLEQEVFVRLRMQPLSSTGSIGSNHMMHSAWESLSTSTFYLLIEPSDQVIRFNQNHTWFASSVGNNNMAASKRSHNGTAASPSSLSVKGSTHQMHHLDFVISGFQYGTVYTFSLHHDYDPAHLPHSLPASFARSIHTKVGCFSAGFEQCCGRGDCVLPTGGSSSSSVHRSQCKCDAGYMGDHCDHYAIAHVTPTVSSADHHHVHANPHSPRRVLHYENVSASDSICPKRVAVSATAIMLPLSSLPHRLSTSHTPPTSVAAIDAASNNQNGGHVSPAATTAAPIVGCGSGEDAQQCCVHVQIRVLHKSVLADSNLHAHSTDYRSVQRQRLQQGLLELLQGHQSAGKSAASQMKVQVIDIGVNEGGRRGQSLTASICGDARAITPAMQAFITAVDSDTVEIKKGHDVYAVQGPVVILATPPSTAKKAVPIKTKSKTNNTTSSSNDSKQVNGGNQNSNTLRTEGVTSNVPIEVQYSTRWSHWTFIYILLMLVVVISLSTGLAWCVRQRSASRRSY